MFPHDPAHSVQANRHPVAGQIPMDLPAACSFPMLQKNGQYLLVQKLSPLPARRHHTPEPRIKSRPGNIKHKALKADRPHNHVAFDKLEFQFACFAKNAVAFFRMSRSILSCRFSAINRATSESRLFCFPLPGKASSPSASHFAFHLRNMPSRIPRLEAA
jgi:hypothetical protein